MMVIHIVKLETSNDVLCTTLLHPVRLNLRVCMCSSDLLRSITGSYVCTWNIHNSLIEFGSDSFEEFYGMLGEKIRLKGWERFRGGLDVKGKIIHSDVFFFYLWTEIGFDEELFILRWEIIHSFRYRIKFSSANLTLVYSPHNNGEITQKTFFF